MQNEVRVPSSESVVPASCIERNQVHSTCHRVSLKLEGMDRYSSPSRTIAISDGQLTIFRSEGRANARAPVTRIHREVDLYCYLLAKAVGGLMQGNSH